MSNNPILFQVSGHKVNLKMVFPCEQPSSGGELCFIRSTHNDLQLKANVFGHVSTSQNKKGWEVWRFVSSNRGDETFFISPWTHSQFYLSSFPGGRVTTTREKNNLENSELWKLEKESNGTEHTIRIRSLAHDRFLQLEGGRLSTVGPSQVSNKCWWNLESAHLDKYYLHCMGRNRQLGCPKSIEEAPLSTKSFDASDVWIIQKAEQGSGFSIRSDRSDDLGLYLRSTQNSSQVTLSAEPGTEGWHLTHHPNNGSVVISSNSGGTLVCSHEGRILLDDDYAATQSNSTNWKLVPHMPGTTTRQQLVAFVGAGIGTMTLGMATPHLVVGILYTLGFTAHGIEANSMAANEMSRVAKSHGGTIPPGCWFAMLQSIGVLGLDTTWFLIAMVIGILVSAGFFRVILVVSGVLERKSDPCTSGIVPSENIGGILSTLDDSVYERPTSSSSRPIAEERGLAADPTITPAYNNNNNAHHQVPTGSEILVVHENHPLDGSLSIGSSQFADASSASRAPIRSAEGQPAFSQ